MRFRGIGIDEHSFRAHAQLFASLYKEGCTNLGRSVPIQWTNPSAVKRYYEVSTIEELTADIPPPVIEDLFLPADAAAGLLPRWLELRDKYYLPQVNKFLDKAGLINGRLHVEYMQNLASGRIATRSPNIQGLEGGFKKHIVPGFGYKFVVADFGGQELGIAAHLSQDKAMLRIIKKGNDLHSVTAQNLWEAQWMGGTEDNCTFPKKCDCKFHKNLRGKAKTILFGLMYGLGMQGLSERLAVSLSHARKIVNNFHDLYPQLNSALVKWSNEPVDKLGFSPKYHRPRYYTKNVQQAARNSPVQTTGAEMLKLSMVRLHEAREKYKAELILPVHDEILSEVVAGYEDAWLIMMERIMNDTAAELTEPGLIKVDIRIADQWKP